MQYHQVCSLDLNKEPVSWKARALKWFREIVQVSGSNPYTTYYFRSLVAIKGERDRQTRLRRCFFIHPLSMFRVYWEALYTILFLFTLFLTPFNIIYLPYTAKFQVSFLDAMILYLTCGELPFQIAGLIDMLVSCITGYCKPRSKTIEMSRSKILKTYLQSKHFYCDLIACFPWYIIYQIGEQANVILSDFVYYGFYLLEFMKLVRIIKLKYYFDNSIIWLKKWNSIISITKYMIVLCLIIHWINCFYLFLARRYRFTKTVRVYSLYTSTVFEYASTRAYLIVAFVNAGNFLGITLGNGFNKFVHHRAKTTDTMIIFFCSSILGFIVINFCIIIIIQIAYSLNSSEIKYHSIVNQIKSYMLHKDLNLDTQNRVLVYYEYRFQQKYFRESTIMNLLSDTLCEDIFLHSSKNLIQSVPILKELHTEILLQIITNFKPEVFLYRDTIIKAGMPGDCMYFIANGTVAVLTPNGKEICHLQDGAYFGEIALINDSQKRISTIIAIEICTVYRLDKRMFKKIYPINSMIYKKIEKTALERTEKTTLMEQLHKKYILDFNLTRQADHMAQHYNEN